MEAAVGGGDAPLPAAKHERRLPAASGAFPAGLLPIPGAVRPSLQGLAGWGGGQICDRQPWFRLPAVRPGMSLSQ